MNDCWLAGETRYLTLPSCALRVDALHDESLVSLLLRPSVNFGSMKFLLIALLSWAAPVSSSSVALNSQVDVKFHFHYYSNENGIDMHGKTREERGQKFTRHGIQAVIGIGKNGFYNELIGVPIEAKNSFSFTTGLSMAPIKNPVEMRVNGTLLWYTECLLLFYVHDMLPGIKMANINAAPMLDRFSLVTEFLPLNVGEHIILRTNIKARDFNSSRLAIGYSILCPEHMYGRKCATFCLPNRNYECSNKGGKLCRPGWSDANTDCKTPSGCTAYYCLNGGTCVEGAKEFTCTCPAGFEGSRCQMCNLNCNRGICALQSGKATCKCPINASGPDCGVAVDPCDKLKPCSNRGECLYKVAATGHIRYECVCKPGFAGLDCNNRADACKDNMCVNGSTCVNNANSRNGFQCLCPAHATGVFCEKDVNECEANPELCDKDTEKCINTYDGYYCEINKHGHCKNVDCGEGGTCKDLDYKYVCECKRGWSGHNCNFSMQEQRKNNLALISPNGNFYDGQSSVDNGQSSVDNGSGASEGDPIFTVLAMGLAAAAAWLHWPRDQ